MNEWRCAGVLPAVAVLSGAIAGTPTAAADNKRLNDGVVAVYGMPCLKAPLTSC